MSENVDAKWEEISLPLLRHAISVYGKDNIACIRINPGQMQKYEEQGFAMTFVVSDSSSTLTGSEPITIGGLPVDVAVSQSLNHVDFIGHSGKTVGRIYNLEFMGFNCPGASEESIKQMARRGTINYRTMEHMLTQIRDV
jgi:hypothetical protein